MAFKRDKAKIMPSVSDLANEVAEVMEKPVEKKKPKEMKFISTGSTLLNLALTDRIDGGWPLGDMVNLVGDSNAGKSLSALTMMAEGVKNEDFQNYKFLYHAVETGVYFPLVEMFGKNIKRIEIKKKSPYTVQQWKSDVMQKASKPLICVLDSADALTTEEELKALSKDDDARKEGFSNLLKPKAFSSALSPIVGKLNENNGLLLIISQTRSNIGVMFGPAKRRAGGDALRFYSSCEVWLSHGSKILKKVRGVEREIGEYITAKVARTRITGKKHTIILPVYDQLGIDDVGSMIDWMQKELFWGVKKIQNEEDDDDGDKKKKKKFLIDTGADFLEIEPVEREVLIHYIETNNKEDELKRIVQESWNTLESELSLQRKSRY
jgi:recombination protein RecA